ncbi:hypothetical protein [Frankia sp. ArI3]|uniref:hypothetical protein n=1 Tax=Frankia sp. ArI3 TaxID=1858 RepID=UPI00210664AE|nr:hypothetical protein [Frankia sp. ArI3]
MTATQFETPIGPVAVALGTGGVGADSPGALNDGAGTGAAMSFESSPPTASAITTPTTIAATTASGTITNSGLRRRCGAGGGAPCCQPPPCCQVPPCCQPPGGFCW